MRFILYFFAIITLSFYDDFSEKMRLAKEASLGIVEPDTQFWDKNGIRHLPFDPPFKFDPAGVYFSGTFTNGTVLQRANDQGGNQASVYGSAPPGSKVTVTLTNDDGLHKDTTVTATKNGEWKWTLPPFPAGGNYTFVASCDQCSEKTSMYNVTFGDVWYCAGQSNMELALRYTFSRNISWNAYKNGSYHNIRLFHQEKFNILDEDRSWVLPPDKGGEWIVDIEEEDFMNFAAVCWYFAEELTNRLGEDAPPIGLVFSAIGGTMVEAWTMNHTLDDCQMEYNNEYHGSVCNQTANPSLCGGLFNGMVAPYLNTTIKGVLWWQGENNMHESKGNINNNTGYACMFNKMKNQWQEMWSATPGTTDKEFGFGVVLLADGTSEGGADMPGMRWAQTLNYGVIPNPAFPNGFMATAHDLGDPWWGKSCWGGGSNICAGWDQAVPFSSTRTPYFMGPIHPRVKFEVGRRLAVSALNVVYGQKELPPSGPTISSCKFEMDRGKLAFTIQFNATMMNPKGIVNGGQNQLYVKLPGFKNPPPNFPSVLQLLFNDTWIPAQFSRQKDEDGQAGRVLFEYDLNGGVDMPTQIRYAWNGAGANGGCCPGQDMSIRPCPPRSCPIMQMYNISDPGNYQIGREMGLPANPFWAKLKFDTSSKTGSCQCFEPQFCG